MLNWTQLFNYMRSSYNFILVVIIKPPTNDLTSLIFFSFELSSCLFFFFSFLLLLFLNTGLTLPEIWFRGNNRWAFTRSTINIAVVRFVPSQRLWKFKSGCQKRTTVLMQSQIESNTWNLICSKHFKCQSVVWESESKGNTQWMLYRKLKFRKKKHRKTNQPKAPSSQQNTQELQAPVPRPKLTKTFGACLVCVESNSQDFTPGSFSIRKNIHSNKAGTGKIRIHSALIWHP